MQVGDLVINLNSESGLLGIVLRTHHARQNKRCFEAHGGGSIMQVGDLVRVRTKHHGNKLGVIIKIDDMGVHIKPQNHPRDIIAMATDVTVLVSSV